MIRLILLILLLLVSLLAIFKAPEFHLWLTAIVVAEYAWVFVFITILILLAGRWFPAHRLAGTIMGCIALILFCTPVIRASFISAHLYKNMEKAFGPVKLNRGTDPGSPFSIAAMFRNSNRLKVPFTTVTYKTYKDVSLKLDFYASLEKGKRPCVLIVHGGSWKSGDSKQLPELNNFLARQGYHAAAINYRLAPGHQNPAPVEDVRNAIRYLKEHADALKIDTTKIVILGRSAGAQIALLAAYTTPDPDIKGVIDFYGPADMVWGYSIPSNPLIMNSRNVMEDYLGGTYKQVPQNFVASSPLIAAEKYQIPTLIIHGDNDVIVSPIHSARLDSLLEKKHTPHYLLKLPWATHAFDYNLNGPGGQLSTYAVLKFINAITS